jgi:molybdopterin converting factor small subunit
VEIQLKLFADLRKAYPPGVAETKRMEVTEGTTIRELLELLRIPEETARIVLKNAVHAKPEEVILAGDLVAIFPPLAGG